MTNDPDVAAEALASRPYRVVIRGNAIEGFLAEAPELPGCVTAGETIAEAEELLQDAMRGWIAARLAAGEPVPSPEALAISA